MKKLTGILIAAALILAPMSVSALEMMTDSNMKDVTGQAGVSIALDDVVLFQDVGRTVYTDIDGLDTQYAGTAGAETSGSASVFITGQQQMTFINAIGGAAAATVGMANNYTTNYDYIGIGVGSDFRATFSGTNYITTNMPGTTALGTSLQGLTIDVGTCGLLTVAAQNAGEATGRIAGVIIGLPNLEIVSSSSDKDIGIQTQETYQAAADNDGMSFIRISEEASTTAILDGYVEIAPH